MNPKREALLYAAICVVVILLCAAGLVYGFLAELIFAPDTLFTLDGILLLLVCLSMGGLFAAMLAWLVWKEGWIRFSRRERSAPESSPGAGEGEKEQKESSP